MYITCFQVIVDAKQKSRRIYTWGFFALWYGINGTIIIKSQKSHYARTWCTYIYYQLCYICLEYGNFMLHLLLYQFVCWSNKFVYNFIQNSNKIVSTNLFYINSVFIAQLLCIVSVNPTLAVYKAAESVPFTNLTWSTYWCWSRKIYNM